MSDKSAKSEATYLFALAFVGAIAIGLSLGFLHLIFGEWNTRPRGAYACLWAALVTGFGICAGLFFWGISSVAARYETGQVQINPLSGTNAMFGGLLILVSGGRILYLGGVAMGLFAPPTGVTPYEQADLAKKQQSQQQQQRRAAQQAVEQTARTNVAREWIQYLQGGGHWTMEVFPPLASEVAEPDLGSGSPTGAPPSIGAASGAGRIAAPTFHVLVLGPPDLLQTKPTIRFGTPAESIGNELKERVDAYLLPTDIEARRQFLQAMVDAVEQQEIGAVVVEVVLASPQNSDNAAGGAVGAGSLIGGNVGAEGATAASLPELQVGMPISLEKAKVVSSAELRQWLGFDVQP